MATPLQVQFDETTPDAARLGQVFGVEGAELQERMQQLAAAAFAEYTQAFGGSRVPSTMRDVREQRLRLLYEHLPEGLPTDDQIGALFQLTRTQVSTLVAGTRARFGPETEGRMKKAAIAALEGATKVDDNTVRIVAPDSLGRYLNDLVVRTQAAPPEKRRDASQKYDVRRSTVIALAEQLGLDVKAVKAIKWE